MKTKYPGIEKYTTNRGDFYRVRVRRNVFGKQKEKTRSRIRTIAEAREIYSQLMTEFDEEEQVRIPTLREYWEEYRALKIKTGMWSKATLHARKSYIAHWLAPFGDRPLDTITKNEIQNQVGEFYNVYHYKERTVKVWCTLLGSIFKDAIENQLIAYNPVTKVIEKDPQGNVDPPRVLSPEDYFRFMDHAKKEMKPDHYRAVYLLTFGLRRGEVLGIKPKAIQFLNNGMVSIHIECQRTNYAPNGKDPKSKKSKRYVVLDETAAEMIKEQMAFARKIKARYNQILTPNDFIFINESTGVPYDIDTLRRAINRVAKSLGLHLHPHMFRHMFATQALASGVDSLALQKYLGHADLSMTDYYAESSIAGGENIVNLTRQSRGEKGVKRNERK